MSDGVTAAIDFDPRREIDHLNSESSTRTHRTSSKNCVLSGDMHDEIHRIDQQLREIATQRQQLLAREARLLVRAEELEIWKRFGCVHLYEYLERYCDMHPRTAREYVRVAGALTELPQMRACFESKQIVYSTVRELTRIATPETEERWLRAVAGMTPREVEHEVAGRKKGDSPNDAKDPDGTVKLVLEVRGSTYAQFVDARLRLSDERGERLSDDEVVLAFSRADGENNDRPAHQLAISTCKVCAKSHQIAGGREIEVSAATLERARCDGQFLGDLELDFPKRATSSVSKRMRQHVLMRDGFTCCVPGCRSRRFLDIHHIVPRSMGGSNKASNLMALCWGHHQQHHEGRITGTAPHGLLFTWKTDPLRTSTRHTDADGLASRAEVTFDEVARAAQAALEGIPPPSVNR